MKNKYVVLIMATLAGSITQASYIELDGDKGSKRKILNEQSCEIAGLVEEVAQGNEEARRKLLEYTHHHDRDKTETAYKAFRKLLEKENNKWVQENILDFLPGKFRESSGSENSNSEKRKKFNIRNPFKKFSISETSSKKPKKTQWNEPVKNLGIPGLWLKDYKMGMGMACESWVRDTIRSFLESKDEILKKGAGDILAIYCYRSIYQEAEKTKNIMPKEDDGKRHERLWAWRYVAESYEKEDLNPICDEILREITEYYLGNINEIDEYYVNITMKNELEHFTCLNSPYNLLEKRFIQLFHDKLTHRKITDYLSKKYK